MEPRLVAKVVILAVVVALVAYRYWSRHRARQQLRELQAVVETEDGGPSPEPAGVSSRDRDEERRRQLVEEGSWTVEPIQGPVRVVVVSSQRRSFPTAAGGELVVPPGPVELEWETGFAHRDADDPEGLDVLSSRLRYRDGGGTVWTAEGAFGPVFAARHLFPSLDGVDSSEPRAARFVATAPEAWQRALRERCVVAGARDLWDERFYHPLILDGEERTILLKYQGPTVDLAVLREEGEEDRLLVRVSGLYDEDHDELPPLLFAMPLEDVVFRNTAGREEGVDHVVELGEDRPLVWSPAPSARAPAFRPD